MLSTRRDLPAEIGSREGRHGSALVQHQGLRLARIERGANDVDDRLPGHRLERLRLEVLRRRRHLHATGEKNEWKVDLAHGILHEDGAAGITIPDTRAEDTATAPTGDRATTMEAMQCESWRAR